MKIGIMKIADGPCLAAVYGDQWVEVPKALAMLGEEPINEMSAFISRYCDTVVDLNNRIRQLLEEGRTAAFTHPLSDAVYLPPLPESPVLFTARGNSACFTRVRKNPICKQPVMEQRYNFNLVGHDYVNVIRDGWRGFGWNYEMIVVMGKPCHGVTVENAEDYIFGYSNMLEYAGGHGSYPFREGEKWAMPNEDKIFADWAYEDCYNGCTQTPTPIGPWITTKDEVGDPHEQMLEERESGRLVSYAHCRAVVFTINEMVSYASGFMKLHPGDMMSTASITYDAYQSFPELPENAYVQAKTDKLGTLRLRMKDERTKHNE